MEACVRRFGRIQEMGTLNGLECLVDKNVISRQRMTQVDIGGHPPVPIGSSCQFLLHHVLLYFFVIVGSILLGMSESLNIFQVDTSGLPPNPTGLFCIFSCPHILLYFQGRFGALNSVFLARHSQTVDGL
jgi:hypothetical protein